MKHDNRPLNIVHVTRAPVGGIFRHILDLAEGQIARGHSVGFVCDSQTGGDRAKAAIDAIASRLRLGVVRLAIAREPSVTDPYAFLKVRRHLTALRPDVMHGHGAKGGAFVRLMSATDRIRVYTPHGGSLHYGRHTIKGMAYAGIERLLKPRTELFLFESHFAQKTYSEAVGPAPGIVRVVPNGITAAEIITVEPASDAADILCVGEFRHIKGIDVLIEAVALLHRDGKLVQLAIAGDGEEGPALRAQVARLNLKDAITFLGHMPARQAFARGRLLVMPSRADSFPYVALEAGGAGLPIIASNVGGIPEILGADGTLVAPEKPDLLAATIAKALDKPGEMRAAGERLRNRVKQLFSQDAMVKSVMAGYREALAAQRVQAH